MTSGHTTQTSSAAEVRSGASPWTPRLGAWLKDGRACFRVWAPGQQAVDVVWQAGGARQTLRLQPQADGTHTGQSDAIAAGARYRYRLQDGRELPDPASRFQPEGVHGPSEVIDPSRFRWTDGGWKGVALQDLVLYELHVGTFSHDGTFAGVESRLDHLQALGVTALELMPIAEWPGRWNWGYDGVDLFAPSHRYGRPDDLRRLVNAAHERGLAVVVDVVYNHLGPDGAYLGALSPQYFTERYHTPWGAALNLDGPDSERVREFFVENALHWIHEYHVDGLRLDATHELYDESERHLLAEIAAAAHAATGRPVLVTAEDDRNLALLASPARSGGYGLDALWADDFHHQIRRLIAGDTEGYFANFTGSLPDLARTLQQGWFYTGQATPAGTPRGSDPAALRLRQFVICIQNHDQIGNRPFGDRLTDVVEPAVYRAASALLLCAPETPMLFMGQEWGATTPFQYFTDHGEELGRRVTEGRRAEFAAFSAFADPAQRERIPDPQAPATMERCRLHWDELDRPEHQRLLRLYQALLALRRTTPALRAADRDSVTVAALDEATLALWCHPPGVDPVVAIVRFAGAGAVTVPQTQPAFTTSGWSVVLTTEDPEFSSYGRPPRVDAAGGELVVSFDGPAAVVLRGQVVAPPPVQARDRA